MSTVHLVAATLLEYDQDILLVKEGKEHVKGLWNLPAGGVHEGEDPRDAAVREVKEEAGLDVELQHFIGAYHHPRSDKPDVVIFVFHAQSMDDPSVPETDEILDVQYWNPADFDSIDLRSPYIEEAVNDYFAGHRYPLSTIKALSKD